MAQSKFAEFWDERGRAFARADPEGWAAVCHRAAPLYFNRFVNWSQQRAFERLLTHMPLRPGEPAVDVGCGTGRWTRKLSELGLDAKGFDISPAMIGRARELAPACDFGVADATNLPLLDGSQQVATAMTVLHHMSYDEQVKAVGELVRVLKPGGYCMAIVLRNVLPAGAWCYPRGSADWRQLFANQGLTPIVEFGEEYLTPAMVMYWIASGFVAMLGGSSRGSQRGIGTGEGRLATLYRAVHRVSVMISMPMEAAASKWWPRGPAMGLASLYEKRPCRASHPHDRDQNFR